MNNRQNRLLSLKEAAETLNVSVETLILWNEHNILKPTITIQGEIGYTQDQINQFIDILQFSKRSEKNSFEANNTTFHAQNMPADDQSTHENTPTDNIPALKIKTNQSVENGIRPFSPLLISSFAILLGLLIIALFTQKNTLKTLTNQYQANKNQSGNKNKLSSQASGYKLSERNISAPIQLKNDVGLDRNLNIEDKNASRDKITALSALLGLKTSKPSIREQTPIASLLQIQTATNRKISGNSAISENSGDTSAPFFASKINKNDSDNLAIDDDGKIRDDSTKTDTLSTTLGGIGGVIGNTSLKPNADPKIQLIFLSITLLAGVFLFQKQLAYAVGKPQSAKKKASDSVTYNPSQKVLELDQKTDGTVVLYFNGKELKISKPELYSESDRFIERLMALSAGTKELDYDSLRDEEVDLTTPLSKLVTRLGFVGIKRELFFPRTAKHRVFFRRYLTQKDLVAMNLSKDRISNDLS
jgi:hypothetical protein